MKAYKVFNKRTTCVEGSIHVSFYETSHFAEEGTQATNDGEFGLTQIYDSQSNQKLPGDAVEQTQEPNPLEAEHDVQHAKGTYNENIVGMNEPAPPAEHEGNNMIQDSHARRSIHQSSDPLTRILKAIESGTVIRSKFTIMIAFTAYISMVEPKNIK